MSQLKDGSILKEYMKYHDKCRSKFGERSLVLMNVGIFYELYAVINDEISVGPPLYELADLLLILVGKNDSSIPQVDYNNYLIMHWHKIKLELF